MRKAWLKDMGIHLRIWAEPPRPRRRPSSEGEAAPAVPRPKTPTLSGGAEAPLE
jgi:hypothetical protein